MRSLDKVLAGITAVLLIGSALWYGWMVADNIIRPSVATFLLVVIYLGISDATYWSHNPHAKWDANIALHAGLLNVIIIFLTLVVRRIYDGNLVVDFTEFHWVCLAASGLILIGWRITKRHALGYCLMQGVALIAYLPTIGRVLNAPTQTESNVLWAAILISGLVAFFPTWRRFREDDDWLALVYLARVIPSNVVVVYLVAAKNLGWPPF